MVLEEVADLALPCGGSGRWPRWERSDRVGWGAVPKPSRFPGPVGGDDRLFVAVGTSAVCLWETFSLPLGGSSKLGSSPFPSAFFFSSSFPFSFQRFEDSCNCCKMDGILELLSNREIFG